jgi:hypothetical protein
LVDVFGFGVSVKEFFRNAGMVKELNCQPNSLDSPNSIQHFQSGHDPSKTSNPQLS